MFSGEEFENMEKNLKIWRKIWKYKTMKKIVQTAGRTQLGEFAPEFAHLAFEIPGENTSNEWQEAVSDEEYNKIK